MKLYIKNMVCNRCRQAVTYVLTNLSYHPLSVDLGEAELVESLSNDQKKELNDHLHKLGFELIDDKRTRIIEKIKNTIVQEVHHSKDQMEVYLSELVAGSLNHEYSYLSKLFSEIEGKTIERYYIEQKIERVKELIVYDELTLSEIAFELGYSNVAHLSAQFKKITGLTPTHFKKLKENKRHSIDSY